MTNAGPPGRPRLARALGLDANPLRRASDRVETWTRVGLLAVFLIAGPLVAVSAGGWAYHAGFTASQERAAPTSHIKAAPPPSAASVTAQDRANGGSAWAQDRWNGATSARSGEVLAVVMTLTFMALALLAALRLTRALLTRRRLAAWEAAWSRVGPQWSRGRP